MLQRRAVGLVAATALVGLVACSSPDGACAAVSARVPATTAPGATIEVEVSNLFSTCNDQGEGPNEPLTDVNLTLVSVDATGTVIATGGGEAAEDGTAVVRLMIPDGTTGAFSLEYEGSSLGTVVVSG